MSETLRSLEGTRIKRPSRPKRRRRGCASKMVLVVIVAAVLAAAWWSTRDTYPMERVIPADQAYQVFANDVFSKRGRVAGSQIWQVLPESWGVSAVPRMLNQELGVPEWVVNNVVPGACHVSGNETGLDFKDVLFVTRMTRIGALLDTIRHLVPAHLIPKRFVPRIESDYTGGLRLSHLTDAGIYFAVRGRILLVSPSRDTLIRALTLHEDEALPPGAIAQALHESGGEDLRGTVTFAEGDPIGRIFKDLSFALRIDALDATLKCRGTLRTEWQSRMAGLLADLEPAMLSTPPKGMVEISVDFGKPVHEVWTAAGQIAGQQDRIEELWEVWSGALESETVGETVAWPQLAAAVLGPLGPGVRLSWCGVDFNEMVPMPELVATFDAAPDTILGLFAALPPIPADAQPYDLYARYDPETKRVHIPLIGGPSIEPTAGIYGNALLLSSSRTVAETLLEGAQSPEPLSEPGNIYVRIHPRPCVETLVEAAKLLAEYDLLKNLTPETLDKTAAPWLNGSRRLSEITALAAYENGEVTAALSVVCATGDAPLW